MAKFKEGDKFIFNKCKKNKELIESYSESRCFIIGKIYTLYDYCGDLHFKDSEGDERDFDFNISNGYKITKIKD
jgi:hypothetical protein